jgi:phage-related minor tail protein
MSGGNALAVSMSLVAGVAGTVQIAVMGRLGDRIGVVPAFAFAAAVAAGLGALALLAARSSFTAMRTRSINPGGSGSGA